MKKKILIVDDEHEYLDILKTYIMTLGNFTCEVCDNGRAALALIEEGSFDCIFLDLVMPEVGGVEVLREISSKKIDTKVVVLSGFIDLKTRQQCRDYGAYEIVDKPIMQHKLKCILKRVAAI